MTHTPTLSANLITCAACTYRAVLASDGRMLVTDPGDASYDHLAPIRAQRDQLVKTMTRIRQHYATRAPLPNGEALSLQQLQRLYRAVAGEFV